MKKVLVLLLLLALCLPVSGMAAGKKDPLAAWQPKFDPSGAKYTYILSNISQKPMGRSMSTIVLCASLVARKMSIIN